MIIGMIFVVALIAFISCTDVLAFRMDADAEALLYVQGAEVTEGEPEAEPESSKPESSKPESGKPESSKPESKSSFDVGSMTYDDFNSFNDFADDFTVDYKGSPVSKSPDRDKRRTQDSTPKRCEPPMRHKPAPPTHHGAAPSNTRRKPELNYGAVPKSKNLSSPLHGKGDPMINVGELTEGFYADLADEVMDD